MSVFSATILGVQPIPIEVEIDISAGLPFFQIVGLPDAILKESKVRVKSAILQSRYQFPFDGRLVLNLAPSKVKKEGSACELALAAKILAQTGQIKMPSLSMMFLGELALNGCIRSVPELSALAYAAVKLDLQLLVVPQHEAERLAQSLPVAVVGIQSLEQFREENWWQTHLVKGGPKITESNSEGESAFVDLKFSKKWARHLKLAAVGRHHYFVCGPPGCGKTFFAESLRSLFLALGSQERDFDQMVLDALFLRQADELPWAAPHHSASVAGLLGGGTPVRPGAVTRAHGGILFLDELLEFSPSVLDSLREPIEKHQVEVFRAGQYLTFPSRFQIVAAANPCRCGNWKHSYKPCYCSAAQRSLYQSRMSGPFFDRFDVKLFCESQLWTDKLDEKGADILREIRVALKRRPHINLSREAENHLLSQSLSSFRAKKKVIEVAKTISAVDRKATIDRQALEEACQFQDFSFAL